MAKKRKDYKNNIYLIIVLIFLLVFFGIYKLMNNNKNPILDNSKEIVYLYYSNEEYNHKVPAVNIKKISNEINNSINEFVNPYIDKEYVSIDYHYNISGNILALFITVSDYEREGVPNYSFKSFIVNLKELKLLDTNDILKLFNTDIDNISNMLDNEFKKYYNDEVNKNIIDSNISYEKYLKSHEINNFYDQISFDIVNSKLVICLDYNEFAETEKEYYFKDIGHVFYYG